MKKIITNISTLPKLEKKSRVAAYARVSVSKDAMLQSLATQVNYYKKLIKENNAWHFAGVYADEALTGTKDSRAEFQQLLSDCRAGKIDMIITKSISRFARNTVTLLETIRELKALNVDVFFEEQNIHTLSGEGEMILTFLATFAQEESRSASENMKWRIKKDFEQGIIWGSKPCLGYKLVNKQLILVPEEAEIVRLIYQLYIDGHGDEQICKILEERGIMPKSGTKWYWSTIKSILKNCNYTGDLILQKTYRENHLTKRRRVNTGEFNQYIVKENHEPIVSKELFDQVQKIRQQRLNQVQSKPLQKDYVFSGMIRCGLCGWRYVHKITPHNEIWKCSHANKRGPDGCGGKQVPQDKMIEAANHILKRKEFDEKYFKSLVESIEVLPEQKLVFNMKNKSQFEFTWKSSRSDSWTPEMREKARIKALNQWKGSAQNG